MMVKNRKSSIFRDALNSKGLVKVAGAHDGLSAKLAEKNGFNAVWASGLGISAVQTVPDASILTMTEFLEAAVIMNESCNLPVIADCDSGYGNIHNVTRMIKKYEAAGIAGVCIEDKVYPKLNSFDDRQQILVSTEEFCAKIRAAKMAQQNDDFVLIARVEALIAKLGQEEAYTRAKAYVHAGADAILIHSKEKSPDEIIEFVNNWDVDAPLVVVPTKYPTLSMEQLEKLGVKVSIYANQALRASVKAINDTFESIINNKSSLQIENDIVSVNEIFDIQDVPGMKQLERLVHRQPAN
ncbi:isocitrate lyase/phosphoenolpyruvate mutase family protein [Bacillus siamensis]|uniref:isocitrate lyase/phosphoenolpyruvate mutase family protein n=1 Tax=Bacillus siamensis TaxID=659243 RepID=UPI0018E61788|nr:isocitrate lyase/phosphoenolpyruvate mutase family protein [Bacillus siamensis]QQD82729.1 isocitrate lyase/phosphoenolpyruvate mutase family protein [Bacillus siamensis]